MSIDTPARKPPEEVRSRYMRIISNEFRSLQLSAELRSKSIFDLIDQCELLYEQLVDQFDSEAGLRAYIRGYLIFNYFINCFIMVHFHGFDKFIESNEQDFILYLNIFAFYDTNDAVRDKGKSLSLKVLRRWIIEYLKDKKLLSFDVDELYAWLYLYIDYLKQKDQDGLAGLDTSSQSAENGNGVDMLAANGHAAADLRSLNLFEERFPSVELPDGYLVDNGSFDFIPTKIQTSSASPPYPVDGTVRKTAPYPLYEQNDSADELFFSTSSASSVRPKQLPPPVPTALPIQLEQGYDPRPSTAPPGNGQLRNHSQSQPQYQHKQYLPYQQNYPDQQSFSTQNHHHHVNGHGSLDRPLPHPNRVSDVHAQTKPRGKYTICGLKNFGSTCYINLTIQLLFGLLDFSLIFENQGYLQYMKNPKYLQLHQNRQPSKDSGILSEAVFGLLKSFKDHPQASIAPTKFLRVSSLLKPDLNIPYEQQDAQEFLLFVLEILHNELGTAPSQGHEWDQEKIAYYMVKWGINITPEDRGPYISWYQSLLKLEGFSPIHDLFQGHLQSKLICNTCGYLSNNYAPFTILSLPIPLRQGHRVDLTDCLRYYTKDEILTGENAWKCPKCTTNSSNALSSSVLDAHPVFESKRSGLFRLGRRSKSPSKKASTLTLSSVSLGSTTKKLNFIKLPKILFMHLSRFSMTSVTDKLDTVIKYPLMITFNNDTNNNNHVITYKLIGIINHYGTLKSGHYTALVNKSSSTGIGSLRDPFWCYFDDEQIRYKVPNGNINDLHGEYRELNSRDVYVLCYERV